jgi:hypothetical protein
MKRMNRNLLLILLVAALGVWLWLWLWERSYHKVPYSLIEERLYMGPFLSEPPPGTEVVVNLAEAQDSCQVDECLWEPIPDAAPAPSVEWLKRIVDFIDNRRNAGLTVYVHCANGVSRSGMAVTAYLMYEHYWTCDQALEFVQSKRPEVRPHPVFMQLLTEWEEQLKDSK